MTEQPIPEAVASTPRSKRTGLIITFGVILALLAWGIKESAGGSDRKGMVPGVIKIDHNE